MIGRTLGRYRIDRRIGEGGMGVVYAAHDNELEREVAIKILPPEIADRYEARAARFEREAKAIAALAHPNICTLFDIGHEDGVRFLVMELIEGESLADRLTRGPLPLDQVLRHGAEIADALERAHRKGIVHRDLKPANVMLTKTGAKLLDFGVAQVRHASLEEMKDLSTAPEPLTGEGELVGTFRYMAPEQLEGKEADARTDIFALGVLLYEMATGASAFSGGSRASLIAAILSGNPRPVSELQPLTPPMLERIIRKCIEKDPDDRWQSAGDVASELRWVQDGVATSSRAEMAVRPGRTARRLALGLIVIAVVAVLSVGLDRFILRNDVSTPATGVDSVVEFVQPTTGLLIPGYGDANHFAISPDGSKLAWIEGDGLFGQLHVRGLDSTHTFAVEGADEASGPFFSPDGEWIGFLTAGGIRRIPIEGGVVRKIVDMAARGATWTNNDTIVFASRHEGGLFLVPLEGGTPQRLTGSDPSAAEWETIHAYPQFLPKINGILFQVVDKKLYSRGGAIVDLETRTVTPVPELGWTPRYVEPGYVISVEDGLLVAIPFDLQSHATTGARFTVLEGGSGLAIRGFDVSESGMLVYASGSMGGFELDRFDRSGKMESSDHFDFFGFTAPRYSPDGSRIAFTTTDSEGAQSQIRVLDLRRNALTRLTVEGDAWWPHWSPDGGRFAIGVTGEGMFLSDLAVVNEDGTGAIDHLTREDPYWEQPTSWTPDGRTVIFQRQEDPETGWDICSVDPGSGEKARVLLGTKADELLGNVSPDGRSIAYVSNESGRNEVYVRSWPTLENKWQISTRGASHPAWSRDGRELFYIDTTGFVAVQVAYEPELRPGRETSLFETPFGAGTVQGKAFGRGYDVAPDGQSFVWMRMSPANAELHVVLNWLQTLENTGRDGVP